ncbi:MAG: winged helix-turn-helix transcriptional regulator, partial [Acidimicrobiales bacterium]
MTRRESQVLELITLDPLISQQAIAERLGISRSAAAGHIMRLSEKGAIRGRGYLLNEDAYVCVVGGANVDIEG